MTPGQSPTNGQVLVKAAALLQYSSASMIVITAADSAGRTPYFRYCSLIFDKFKEPRPNRKLQRAISVETEMREVVAGIYRAEHDRSAARTNISEAIRPERGNEPVRSS
jgi:hypothetical protein